jgi:hypothetical protein
MVAAALKDVAGKGWDWYKNSESATPTRSTPAAAAASSNLPPPPSVTKDAALPEALKFPELSKDGKEELPATTTKYWNYAQDAAESTYSAVSGYASSISVFASSEDRLSALDENPLMTPSHANNSSNNNNNNTLMSASVLTSPTLLNMFQNPYIRVRGPRGADKPSSMEAVRNLLSVTTPDMARNHDHYYLSSPHSQSDDSDPEEDDTYFGSPTTATPDNFMHTTSNNRRSNESSWNQVGGFFVNSPPSQKQTAASQQQPQNSSSIHQAFVATHNSPSETASQLAEGTLRAYRDIALDEAVELHSALRYWAYRWERPLLSWLEAGPIGKSRNEMELN